MIDFAKRTYIAASFSILIFLGACSKTEEPSAFLEYVPADTPYAIVSDEFLPADLAAKLEPTVEQMLTVQRDVVNEVIKQQFAQMSSGDDDAADVQRIKGLISGLVDLMSLESLRASGFTRESAFALYGNGLLPVVRMGLSDEGLFDAAVEKIEARSGASLQTGSAGGVEYGYAIVEEIKFVLATLDGHAVFTVVPSVYSEAQVARALGVSKPSSSLHSSGKIDAISKEYGYSKSMRGFIDVTRIAGTFAGQASEADQELFAALEKSLPEVSNICAAEITGLAEVAPRIVFGYTEMSSSQVASSMTIELRQDLAAGLQSVSASVPGLGMDSGGLVSFGFGVNPMALREFFAARLDAIEAEPFECENFAPINMGVASGREALNKPVPPVVYSFRGLVANITDIKGMDFSRQTRPESVDASLLVAIDNAESLVMMAGAFDPQIASMNLLPDGKPVKLELEQLADIADSAFAALSEDALSISVGAAAEENSGNMLIADSADPAPFFSMNMDSARYYSMLGAAMSEQDDGEVENQMEEEVRTAMRDMMLLSGALYDRMSVDMRFTERGVEFDATMTLSD